MTASTGDTPSIEPLWTKPFVMVLAVSCLIALGHTMYMAVLPGFAMRIGGRPQDAGLVMGLFSFAALAARPVFGRLLDSLGRQPVLAIGACLFLAGTAGLFFTDRTWQLAAVRIVHGIGFSALTTGAGVVLTDLSPRSRLSEGLGWWQVGNSLALAIGPLGAVSMVAMASGVLVVFCLPVIAGLVALATVITFLIVLPRAAIVAGNPADMDVAGRAEPGRGVLDRIRGQVGPGVFSLAVVILFQSLAVGALYSFATIHGTALKLAVTGWFFPVYAVSSMLAAMTGGTMARRIHMPSLMALGLCLGLVGMVSLGTAVGGMGYLAGAAFLGAGYGLASTMANSMLMSATPQEKRGRSSAVYFAAVDIGVALGSMLGGLGVGFLGFRGLFLAAAGTYLGALASLGLRTRAGVR